MSRYRLNQIKIDPFKVAAAGGGIDRTLVLKQLKQSIQRTVNRELKKTGKSSGSSVSESEVRNISIVRESIDARKKPEVKLVYTADFDCNAELSFDEANVREYFLTEMITCKAGDNIDYLRLKEAGRPVVAGFGPCGIFAGLILAEAGLKPVILERGKPVDKRIADVEKFWKECAERDTSDESETSPDPESNVQFGEGGAGTFSDGKLTTGIRDVRIRKVLREFVAAGAPDEILYRHKPHIGTDKLRDVVRNMRRKIEALGGEVRFESRLENIVIEDGRLESLKVVNTSESGKGEFAEIKTGRLILAVGHSARDTFRMLYDAGFDMKQKAFSIGVRIEHAQDMIDAAQYGNPELAGILGPADYKLSYSTDCEKRGVYTFCMCPGGHVVNASTEPGTSVTNGMSNSSRDGEYANSAVLVDVRTDDFADACGDKHFPDRHPLAGLEFQKKYERLAWENRTHGGMAKTTYGEFRNTAGACEDEQTEKPHCNPVRNSIPAFASEAIMEAMPHFGRKLRGFDRDDAIMTAVESRSSSPVKVLRDENMEASVKGQPIHGIIPAGEGPGYAGGIMSAAVDGIRAAEAVIAEMMSESDIPTACNK